MIKKLRTIMLGGVVMAWGCWVHADPTLTISDGTTTVSVTDGGAGDSASAAGVVTYIGSLGSWFISVSTGISTPGGGDVLHLNSVDTILFAPGGDLKITFQDVGQTYGPGLFGTSIGGTTINGTTVDYTLSNGSTTVASITGLGAYAFGGDTSFTLGSGGPLIQTVKIHQTTPGTTSFDAQVVPDGGTTVTLLGFAMVALEGLRRKAKKLAQ